VILELEIDAVAVAVVATFRRDEEVSPSWMTCKCAGDQRLALAGWSAVV
jgi:hypothetical protein